MPRYAITFEGPGASPDWDVTGILAPGAYGADGAPLDERLTLDAVPAAAYPVTLVVEGTDARRAEEAALDQWGTRYRVVDSDVDPDAEADALEAIESYRTTDGGSVRWDEVSSDDHIDHVEWSWRHACKAHGADEHGFVDEVQDPHTGFYKSTRLVSID